MNGTFQSVFTSEKNLCRADTWTKHRADRRDTDKHVRDVASNNGDICA